MSSATCGPFWSGLNVLTHWGRVTHMCVSKLTIICSDNGLSPGRRQAIICTNAGILLIRTLATNFSEILSKIYTFPLKKMHLKMSSAKWWQFCLGLNVLKSGFSDFRHPRTYNLYYGPVHASTPFSPCPCEYHIWFSFRHFISYIGWYQVLSNTPQLFRHWYWNGN